MFLRMQWAWQRKETFWLLGVYQVKNKLLMMLLWSISVYGVIARTVYTWTHCFWRWKEFMIVAGLWWRYCFNICKLGAAAYTGSTSKSYALMLRLLSCSPHFSKVNVAKNDSVAVIASQFPLIPQTSIDSSLLSCSDVSNLQKDLSSLVHKATLGRLRASPASNARQLSLLHAGQKNHAHDFLDTMAYCPKTRCDDQVCSIMLHLVVSYVRNLSR